MWLFTAPDTDRIFHAGPSRMTHWLDTTSNGQVIEAVKREDRDKMCGNAVMYVMHMMGCTWLRAFSCQREALTRSRLVVTFSGTM